MRSLRSRLTYANVVSTLCLFLVLGGTSYAAATIGSAQIKNNSIQSKDIKNGQLSSADIKNGSLATADFKSGQMPKGATGATGPRGTTGLPGAPGSAGSPAASFLTGRLQESYAPVFAAPLGTSALATTEADVSMLSPAQTVVAKDLAVQEEYAPAWSNAGRRFRLVVNGVVRDTFGCDITGTNTTCSDTTRSLVIPAGSTISLGYSLSHDVSGGSSGPFVRFGWRATTP